jgi:hypothetical protein
MKKLIHFLHLTLETCLLCLKLKNLLPFLLLTLILVDFRLYPARKNRLCLPFLLFLPLKNQRHSLRLTRVPVDFRLYPEEKSPPSPPFLHLPV